MKTFGTLCAAVSLILHPVAAMACAEPTFGPRLKGFQKLSMELTEFRKKELVFEFYGLKEGKGEEGSSIIFETTKDPKGTYQYFLTATETGTADDSIMARQWRFAVDQKGDRWALKTAGERWQCARGKNVGKWTTKTCP